ncbi:MAG: RNA-guided pseudouridylation complex pseudouridine synthase subunit Cbf5 [Desulfurococcaceae archaeon]
MGNVIHSVKEYVMVVQLHESVNSKRVEEVVEYFKGQIYQRPPLRSSVKRSIRVKNIYDIEILDFQDKFLLLRVLCDPGTYMRKLAHDMGLMLGVGAHMRELRRTRTGPFKEDDTLVTLQEVNEALYYWKTMRDERYIRRVVLPVEVSTVHLPKIIILDTTVDSIAHGADLAAPGISMLTKNVEAGRAVAIYTLKGELVAIGRSLKNSEEILRMDKGIVVKTTRVLMPRGVYPRTWKTREQNRVK